MSRQLAVSAAFSVLMMASYVLFGGDTARQPLGADPASVISPMEISVPELPDTRALLPSLR